MDRSGFPTLHHRRKVRRIVTFLIILGVSGVVYLSVSRGSQIIRRSITQIDSTDSIENFWADGRYAKLAVLAEEQLNAQPLDLNALLLAGYSRYLLAISRLSIEERTIDLDLAIRHLRMLLARGGTPDSDGVKYVLGKAYLEKGRFWADLAMKYLLEVYENGYRADDIEEFLGHSYATLGQDDKALEWYLAAADRFPTDRLLYTIGKKIFNLGRYEEAVQFYKKAIEMSTDEDLKKEGLFQLSKLYYDLGSYDMASKIMDELNELKPVEKRAVLLQKQINLGQGG